ncbi:DNA alkylation repair protein [Chryseobacterium soli]|uniref:DNA alkylation repair protein n=1 Tax=Chryseobacterium soli TaxID=445961 RepID=UPI002955C3AD|nr:DNA alkylation repair protein [Chryseobacterium soli]MDV7697560.1 DNA alkylation repair protein [Chryseobacterium soli]
MKERKGARSIKDIPIDILNSLNRGELETVNLTEWLAVDQKMLLEHLLTEHNRKEYYIPLVEKISRLKKQTVNTVNEAIGTGILELSAKHNDHEIISVILKHPADLIRCWSAYTIGRNDQVTIEEMLEQIRELAADKHFGVREISWMAVRPAIAKNLSESLSILTDWTKAEDDHIRRFASESTRPRGVWCAHIEELKQNPESGLIILEPLRSDPSKYVQDSVGNWLNDASKSQPVWVKKYL